MRAWLIALAALMCVAAPGESAAQQAERECLGSAPAAPTNYFMWSEASASISIRADNSFSLFRGGIGMGVHNLPQANVPTEGDASILNSSRSVNIFSTMEGTLRPGRRVSDAGSISPQPARVTLWLPLLHDRRGQRVNDYRLRVQLGAFEKEIALSLAGQRHPMVHLVLTSPASSGNNIALTPEEAETLRRFVFRQFPFQDDAVSQTGRLVFLRNDGREIARVAMEFSAPSFRYQGLTQAIDQARAEYARNACRTRAQREQDIDEAYDDW